MRAHLHSQVQVSKRVEGRSHTVPHHSQPRDLTMTELEEGGWGIGSALASVGSAEPKYLC